jgi:hypothetical protein
VRSAGALVLMLALGDARAAPAPPPAAPVATGAASVPTCPSSDFARFLEAFAEDVALQAAFTRFPLAMRRLDPAADPEPRPVERQAAREEVALPLFPSRQARERQHLQMEVTVPGSTVREVILRGEDDGRRIVLRFEKGACWRLILIDDQSL